MTEAQQENESPFNKHFIHVIIIKPLFNKREHEISDQSALIKRRLGWWRVINDECELIHLNSCMNMKGCDWSAGGPEADE